MESLSQSLRIALAQAEQQPQNILQMRFYSVPKLLQLPSVLGPSFIHWLLSPGQIEATLPSKLHSH